MILYCQWTVRKLAVVVGLLLSVSTLTWGAPSPAAPLKVAATIFPLYDLVRQVAGPVVGVHLVGSRVSELISEAQLITGWEAFPSDVAALSHAHPTLSEALGEAHLALAGKPLHAHG